MYRRANLFFLPFLCLLCIGGLLGLVDNYQVTLIFTAYVIFDLSWILLYPDVLPRYPGVIMVHHIITLALLSHPLRFPQDAHFTCLARPRLPGSPPPVKGCGICRARRAPSSKE